MCSVWNASETKLYALIWFYIVTTYTSFLHVLIFLGSWVEYWLFVNSWIIFSFIDHELIRVVTFQMGNASDTSVVLTSTISKEHDIFMGSLYSLFCESTQYLCWFFCFCFFMLYPSLAQLNLLFFHRYTVHHRQLHTATCCLSQAVNLETSRVFYHQSLHQWPWDDTHFTSTGHTIGVFTQVS